MMRQLRRFAICMAATLVATTAAPMLALGAGTATADGSTTPGGTFVPLSSTLRRCDYSNDTHIPQTRIGTAYALVRKAGNRVTADVYLERGTRNMVYRVRLIELPLRANGCGPGATGTAFGDLITDDIGNGRTTVQQDKLPGANAVWVFIEGPPGEGFYISGEFYTSDFVVPI
jgi:hypothetical protein